MAMIYIRFDIEAIEKKFDTGSYGSACYRVVFENVPARLLQGCWVYMGDSAASLRGHENVCIIGLEASETQLQSIGEKLENNSEFLSVSADNNPLILTSNNNEPLVTDGYFTTDGSQLSGWAASAFKQKSPKPKPPIAPASYTSNPASSAVEEPLTPEHAVKQRHGCLTAWLIIAAIINSVLAVMYLAADDMFRYISSSVRLFESFICALGVLFLILVFKWKRIGFWGVVVVVVAGIITSLSLGGGVQSFTGLVGLMILYSVLHIKKDGVSGWEN